MDASRPAQRRPGGAGLRRGGADHAGGRDAGGGPAGHRRRHHPRREPRAARRRSGARHQPARRARHAACGQRRRGHRGARVPRHRRSSRRASRSTTRASCTWTSTRRSASSTRATPSRASRSGCTTSTRRRGRATARARLGGGPYHTMDWEELNHNLFTALEIQKIMLTLVIATHHHRRGVQRDRHADHDRAREEARDRHPQGDGREGQLRSCGIFMVQGAVIGFVGTAIGLLARRGLTGTCSYQFPLDPKVYLIDHLPVRSAPRSSPSRWRWPWGSAWWRPSSRAGGPRACCRRTACYE